MALVLGLKKGEDVYVDSRQLVVERILSSNRVVIRTDAGCEHECVDNRMVEVLDDVFVSVGMGMDVEGVIRLAIEAPREKCILRGALVRRKK